VLDKKALHPAPHVRQLGIAVSEKDDAQRQTQRQQPKWLKCIEESHRKTPAKDFYVMFWEAAAF
jgi:hypothetical protein